MEEKKKPSRDEILSYMKQISPLLRISDDRMEILSGIEDTKRMGAVLYGLIVGTPTEEIQQFLDREKDTDMLFDVLQSSFMRRCRDNDDINARINKAGETIEKMMVDHDRLWETMKKETESVMQGALAEKDKLIAEKDKIINKKNKELADCDARLQDLKSELGEKNKQTTLPAKDDNHYKLPWFLKSLFQEKNNRRQQQQQREQEVLQYRDEFLLSKKYDKSQKAYLMECMEKGYSFADISQRIGNPDLSVDDMKTIMAVFK